LQMKSAIPENRLIIASEESKNKKE
jgi:hypothetical protein